MLKDSEDLSPSPVHGGCLKVLDYFSRPSYYFIKFEVCVCVCVYISVLYAMLK